MTEPSKPEDVQYDIPKRNGRPFGIREDLYVQLQDALVNQNQVFHVNEGMNENHTAAIDESSSMLDEVMAQVVDLRQKLENVQGKQWDVFTLDPNDQVGYFTSRTVNSTVRISVSGTQTGKIIATIVYSDQSTGQGQSAYTWQLGATREWEVRFSANTAVVYTRIEWQKSATQITRSNTTRRDVNIDEDTWTTLHSLTIPKNAECIASMRIGWHATSNHDYYGLRIRVGNTVVASDGPRNGIGPLTPLGNGYRMMTVANSSFNAAPGDVVTLEVYSSNDFSLGRRVRDATLNIAWLDVG